MVTAARRSLWTAASFRRALPECQYGEEELVAAIAEIDVHGRSDGHTLLSSAAWFRGPAVVAGLLAAGADVDATNVDETTPLFRAVTRVGAHPGLRDPSPSRTAIANTRILLAAGAAPAVASRFGTPLEGLFAFLREESLDDALLAQQRSAAAADILIDCLIAGAPLPPLPPSRHARSLFPAFEERLVTAGRRHDDRARAVVVALTGVLASDADAEQSRWTASLLARIGAQRV